MRCMMSKNMIGRELGRDYDRDKNQTYRPHDEATEDIFAAVDLKTKILTEPAESILSVMQEQHNILRESIHVLIDENASGSEKQKQLLQFINLFTAHSEAEENTIYEELRFITGTQMIVYEALEEHAIAKILIEELIAADFQLVWSAEIAAKAKVLAQIVDRHLLEEETNFFKTAKETFSVDELLMLGKEFKRQFENMRAHQKAALSTLVI